LRRQVPLVVLCAGRRQPVALLRQLVDNAHAAGELRADVVAEDLPGMQCAISRASCTPIGTSVPDAWRRACSIFLDGRRAGAASAPLAPTLPTYEQVTAAHR
jgi:hypothetical protein